MDQSTPAAPPPMSTPRPPRRRLWLRRLVLASAISLVVLLVSHLAWYVSASADLSQARAAAKSAGLIEDLAPQRPPPCSNADNALVPYRRACAILADHPPLQSLSMLQGERERLIATDAAQVLAQLEREPYQAAWSLMTEGASRPGICFDEADAGGLQSYNSVLDVLRHLSQTGTLRARLLAALGQPQAAVDQFAVLLRMSRQFRHGTPDMLMQCIVMSTELQILGDLRQALKDGQLSPANPSLCLVALDDPQRTLAWKRAIQDELAMLPLIGTAGCRDMLFDLSSHRLEHSGTEPISASWSAYYSWYAAPLRAGDEAAYTRLLTDLYVDRRSDDAVSPWHPVTAGYVDVSQNLALHTAHARLLAAANTALRVSQGDAPHSQPGITIARSDDGVWTITPDEVDRMGLRQYAAPWHVPPRP